MAPPKDRRERLIISTTLNGIDFIEIASPDQKTLQVHFLNAVAVQGSITDPEITGGETVPEVPILNEATINDAGHWLAEPTTGQPILTLNVAYPGDFSRYTLKLTSDRLDPFFSQAVFSFKALCPSDLDCETPPPICPPDDPDIPPINYLAKDFLSFREALSDFSSLRYPEWAERSEADFGVMFMEALCALADDLSYTQDRIAAESTLETATQRRSLVRHARLVDYEPRPATAARTVLQFDVSPGTRSLPVGLVVRAQRPDGAIVEFETGTGLVDSNTGLPKQETFTANSRWNRSPGMIPYWWDDNQRCLKAGATDLWIEGHGFNFQGGEALLIETAGPTSADPRQREVIHLLDDPTKAAVEDTDVLFGQPVTHIFWRSKDALKSDHDLTRTILIGNLVPATQGRRYTEAFTIPANTPASVPSPTPLALARTGANSTPDDWVPQYLYTLRNGAIAWLGQDDPENAPLPEILVQQSNGQPWIWRRKLLDAKPFENAFTVDPVSFRRIGPNSDRSVMFDYDSDTGDTIRFGDGIFGELPNPGDTFRVTYRVGGGAIGNVAADAINSVDPSVTEVLGVTNPFPATGGADLEPAEHVRRMAPQAFRAKQFRAVRAEDYQAAAQSLPWVQRAGTVFRWTGSWLTVFTTPDPLGSAALTVEQQTELIDLLNRYRLAGYESYVLSPRYISLDLEIRVCARPDVFRGDVEADLLLVLSAAKYPDGRIGFFQVDRWTFGQSLERSQLESAIQQAYGVAGVVSIRYRRRGATLNFCCLPDTISIPVDTILRVDNDNNRPERGSLNIIVEGGK
jgi:hypothetical protein